MDKKYILRIGSSLMEPIRKNSGSYESVQDGSKFMNAEDIDSQHCGRIWFDKYLTEDGKTVGAVFGCNYGHGYGFDNGLGSIEMRPGDKAHFTYEGTYVDDEGDPTDFYTEFYLELYDWDERLLDK